MKWFRDTAPIFFDNARLADPLSGETQGTLRIARGLIQGINTLPQRGDLRIDLDGAWILPGLVNAHDHLELNNFPRLKYRPCYSNARLWAMEIQARLDSDPEIVAARARPLADRLFSGGLKNLLAGTTTVAHHNPFHAPLRRDFPVRIVRRYGWAHSLYLSPDFAASYRRTPRDAPWMIHLAEGTDAHAQEELAQLNAAGALRANTVLIHGVGLTARDGERVLKAHAALVWCPSSNLFTLNETANVRAFSVARRLALGSDSRLTGERDLLDELRVARATNQISPAALLCAVTCDAAEILRANGVGRIARGHRADLVILPKAFRSAADALGETRRADLRAVILNGAARIADADFARLMKNSTPARLDGHVKILARDLAERYARNSIREAGLELA